MSVTFTVNDTGDPGFVTVRFGVIVLDVKSGPATFVLVVLLDVCTELLNLVLFVLDKVLTVADCVVLEGVVLDCIVWSGEVLVVLDCEVVVGGVVAVLDCEELLVSV